MGAFWCDQCVGARVKRRVREESGPHNAQVRGWERLELCPTSSCGSGLGFVHCAAVQPGCAVCLCVDLRLDCTPTLGNGSGRGASHKVQPRCVLFLVSGHWEFTAQVQDEKLQQQRLRSVACTARCLVC